MRKLPVCMATGGWYHRLFQAEKGADAAFAYIKSLGFEGLDYGLNASLSSTMIERGEKSAFLDAPLEELIEFYRPVKEASQKHGLPIAMAHGAFPMYSDADPAMGDYLIRVTEKMLAVCQYLGCPMLVVHPITRADYELEKKMSLDMYRKLIPAAKKCGVTVCLENLFYFKGGHAIRRACSDMNEACWYIDTLNAEAGEEIFGFCYDVGHANVVGNRIEADLKLLGKRLKTLHIHDNDGRVDKHMLPFTQTDAKYAPTTDWEGFLRGLKAIEYEGPLNFETFASVMTMPLPMVRPLHTLTWEIGNYFRNELTK